MKIEFDTEKINLDQNDKKLLKIAGLIIYILLLLGVILPFLVSSQSDIGVMLGFLLIIANGFIGAIYLRRFFK